MNQRKAVSRDGVVAGERQSRPDIGEIARLAGVARSTVSYVLSGKRAISEETRRRVLKVVEEVGYRPNASARALAEGRSRTIGLVIPPPATHRLLATQLEFVAILSDLASSSDLDLLLSPSSGDHDRSFLRMLSGRRVDGVLVMEVRMEDHRIDALERSRLPYVLIGRPANPEGLFWADFDFGGLVERCVGHLADLGHRNVALLNRPAEMLAAGYGPAHRSLAAFQAAVERRGLRGFPFCCPDDPRGGEACMSQILAARPRITAAVSITEGGLPGVARALDAARVHVPRDFSITGVVERHWAEDFRPKLTSASVSATELAKSAFDMLLERIARRDTPPRHVLQAPQITLRASTARAPTPAGSRPSRG